MTIPPQSDGAGLPIELTGPCSDRPGKDRALWFLDGQLGSGSTSKVWRLRRGAEVCALKVGAPEFATHFESEARALVRACSAQLPTLLAAGRLAPATAESLGYAPGTSLPYLLLAHAPGVPLSELWDRATLGSALTSALAQAVARDVGRALANLHAVGLAHGDVKPANIIVQESSNGFYCTLIDLGLVSDASSTQIDGATPRYLPPNLERERDARARDVWALGVTLAEVLQPEARHAGRGVPLGATYSPWLNALLSPTPSERPRADWVARFHAAPPDVHLAKRSYLKLRWDELLSAACAEAGAIAVTGLVGDWLQQSRQLLAEANSISGTGTKRGSVSLGPLSLFQQRQWLVSCLGPRGVDFPLLDHNDNALADALANAAARVEATLISKKAAAQSAALATDPLQLALRLGSDAPDDLTLEQAEQWVLRDWTAAGGAPGWLRLHLARALKRRGELARALNLLRDETSLAAQTELASVYARLGNLEHAASLLEHAIALAADSTAEEIAHAQAQLIRVRLHQGQIEQATKLAQADAPYFSMLEARASVALTLGNLEAARTSLEAATGLPVNAEQKARLLALKANLAQQVGAHQDALQNFKQAAEQAARAGSLLEQATYLAGVAGAALELGASAEALSASERAILLFEYLERPELAARAALTIAATLCNLGALEEAVAAARDALQRAEKAGDQRCQAFAQLVLAEALPEERAQLLTAATALLNPLRDADRVRLAAYQAELAAASERLELDQLAVAQPKDVQFEWWAARAALRLLRDDGSHPATIFEALDQLRYTETPMASRGRAFAFGAQLAAQFGEGERVRSYTELATRAHDTLAALAPEGLRFALRNLAWTRSVASAEYTQPFNSSQMRDLERMIGALGERGQLRSLLLRVVDGLVLWTGVERGLLLLKAPNNKLVPRAARNLSRKDLSGEQRFLSMSLAQQAFDSGECVVAVDASGELSSYHQSVHALHLRSVLAVPLRARGETLGVVYLDDRMRTGAFGSGELAWTRLLASLAAVAIADTRDQILLQRAARKAQLREAQKARQLDKAAADLRRTSLELRKLQGPSNRERFGNIVGESPALHALLRLVERVANSDVPVLLRGESGSGKELIARALHEQSARKERPFIAENCSAIPESLLESVLFGHARGAFTGAVSTHIGLFEAADGGTLFLDEIADMSLAMQVKLLRVLESGELRRLGSERSLRINVRVLGASHQNLEEQVALGKFRPDLLYRLNVMTLEIPALRERSGDVAVLVKHFLERHSGVSAKSISQDAMAALEAYAWPGNVRQLENEIRRAVVLADSVIQLEHLSPAFRPATGLTGYTGHNLRLRLNALETELISRALRDCGGNQTKAAQLLGVSRFGLQKMLKRLELAPQTGQGRNLALTGAPSALR